jgi:hypothetical protein
MSIEQIKIVIKTAIPGKEPFELKSSMIHIIDPDEKLNKLNDYPFITATHQFNKPALQKYLYVNGYTEIVKFFFSKKEFGKFFNLYTIANPNPAYNPEILIKNVKIMLELLFPMSFPATLNVTDSFELYIRQNIDLDLNAAFSNVSKNFFKRFTAAIQSMKVNDYSYLKLDGNVYTVTKVIWLNDLLNHPVYRDFINEFIGFKQLANEQRELLKENIKDKTTALFENIRKRHDEMLSLNIYEDYIDIFLRNVNTNRIKESRYDSQKLETFNRDLQKIIFLLIDIALLHKTITPVNIKEAVSTFMSSDNTSPPSPPVITYSNPLQTMPENYLSRLSTIINDIDEIYKRLKNNSAGTLTGIPKTFSTNVTKIMDEIQSITISTIIKDKYLSENANINLEGEDPGVVSELSKNFPTYVTFSSKIKALLSPERFTTNKELHERIINYSKGKNDNADTSFDKIMTAIQEQFILMTNTSNSIPDLNKPSIQPLLNTQVCVLDKRKQNAPHYEIYVALNLIEGEIQSNNLNTVICAYRSMYLGNEVQNYFTKYNKYDIDQHLFYLSQKTIKNGGYDDAENELPLPPAEGANAVAPPTPPPLNTGGKIKKHTKTHKNIHKGSRKTLRK